MHNLNEIKGINWNEFTELDITYHKEESFINEGLKMIIRELRIKVEEVTLIVKQSIYDVWSVKHGEYNSQGELEDVLRSILANRFNFKPTENGKQ